MNYGEVLSTAWKTIWKYKVLWLFGVLAALGTGGGGGGGGNGSSYRMNNGDFSNSPFGPNFGAQVESWVSQNWWVIVVLVLVFLLLALVFVVLSTFGRIGLIKGTWQTDEGKTRLSVAELWRDSAPYFWRMILLALLLFGLGIGVAILITIPLALVAVFTLGIGLLCLIPFLCLLIPIGWAVNILLEEAMVAIVGENLGVIDGLKRGWEVFRANLAPSIVMGLILGVGGSIVRVIIALPAVAIAIPLVVGIASQTGQAFNTGAIISLVLLCLYMPVALFLSGVLTAYLGSSWTLTFRRLTGRGKSAEVVEALPVA